MNFTTLFKLPKDKTLRKTILNVVAVYLTTTILLLFALSFIYIQNQQEQFRRLQTQQTNTEARYILDQLELLHDDIVYELALYPRDNINSAIYDIDKNLIFSTFDTTGLKTFDTLFFTQGEFNYYVYEVDPYYLGAAYLIIQKPTYTTPKHILFKLIGVVLLVILLLIFTSLIFSKILIKPLSDNLTQLDRFIKDTTHELNTPVSAILTNIEMLDIDILDEKNKKKIERIKIGAQNISNIYDDLSFLLLHNKHNSHNERINIANVLKERIQYFDILSTSKQIKFNLDIDDKSYMVIDRLKIERLFDNLISNSIKYSGRNTTINITLHDNFFSIEDNGIGMDKHEVEDIFTRYKRFDHSVGGFGVGYSIIGSIIREYNIQIDIKSEKQKGTKVTLIW